MRWLIIVLLGSLLALLIAAASVACHILIQRAKLRRNLQRGSGKILTRQMKPTRIWNPEGPLYKNLILGGIP